MPFFLRKLDSGNAWLAIPYSGIEDVLSALENLTYEGYWTRSLEEFADCFPQIWEEDMLTISFNETDLLRAFSQIGSLSVSSGIRELVQSVKDSLKDYSDAAVEGFQENAPEYSRNRAADAVRNSSFCRSILNWLINRLALSGSVGGSLLKAASDVTDPLGMISSWLYDLGEGSGLSGQLTVNMLDNGLCGKFELTADGSTVGAECMAMDQAVSIRLTGDDETPVGEGIITWGEEYADLIFSLGSESLHLNLEGDLSPENGEITGYLALNGVKRYKGSLSRNENGYELDIIHRYNGSESLYGTFDSCGMELRYVDAEGTEYSFAFTLPTEEEKEFHADLVIAGKDILRAAAALSDNGFSCRITGPDFPEITADVSEKQEDKESHLLIDAAVDGIPVSIDLYEKYGQEEKAFLKPDAISLTELVFGYYEQVSERLGLGKTSEEESTEEETVPDKVSETESP